MISHNAVRDLLPSYIDGICSEETQKEIKEHLLTCGECFKTYEAMAANTESTETPPLTAEEREEEIKKLNYMRKVKNKAIIKWVLIALAIAAVLGIAIFALCYGVPLDSSQVALTMRVYEDDVIIGDDGKPELIFAVDLENNSGNSMVIYPWTVDILHVKWGGYEKGALRQQILNVRKIAPFMSETTSYTSNIIINEDFAETFDEYQMIIKFKDKDVIITTEDILKLVEKYENRFESEE
jgi:hypothetical protein